MEPAFDLAKLMDFDLPDDIMTLFFTASDLASALSLSLVARGPWRLFSALRSSLALKLVPESANDPDLNPYSFSSSFITTCFLNGFINLLEWAEQERFLDLSALLRPPALAGGDEGRFNRLLSSLRSFAPNDEMLSYVFRFNSTILDVLSSSLSPVISPVVMARALKELSPQEVYARLSLSHALKISSFKVNEHAFLYLKFNAIPIKELLIECGRRNDDAFSTAAFKILFGKEDEGHEREDREENEEEEERQFCEDDRTDPAYLTGLALGGHFEILNPVIDRIGLKTRTATMIFNYGSELIYDQDRARFIFKWLVERDGFSLIDTDYQPNSQIKNGDEKTYAQIEYARNGNIYLWREMKERFGMNSIPFGRYCFHSKYIWTSLSSSCQDLGMAQVFDEINSGQISLRQVVRDSIGAGVALRHLSRLVALLSEPEFDQFDPFTMGSLWVVSYLFQTSMFSPKFQPHQAVVGALAWNNTRVATEVIKRFSIPLTLDLLSQSTSGSRSPLPVLLYFHKRGFNLQADTHLFSSCFRGDYPASQFQLVRPLPTREVSHFQTMPLSSVTLAPLPQLLPHFGG